jgi:hypothetical protein
MIRRTVTPAIPPETDEEFARAIGIILPENESDQEVEDNTDNGNSGAGDPWSDRHCAPQH